MKNTPLLKKFFWMLVLPILLTSCKDMMDEYYKTPGDLKGSIREVLEKRGNYSIFLKGAELAGFGPMIDGKSILTVMAPNDSAFHAYFEKEGITSLEDMPADEIKKLIGFHILYYAFDKNKLINFRPNEGDEATKDEKLINAGLYYKHRTKSNDAPTMETDTSGAQVLLYHLERFLPVFSYKMFQTKQIDAAYNYEYFYPNSRWNGNLGYNVSNASVTTYNVIADNGYIHLINEVLRPLETIYKELAGRENYSTFLKLYNQYEYYAEDKELTLEYGDGKPVYQHYHSSPLANIACEWPVSNYADMSRLSYTSYSVFAPSNNAIQEFFNSYWKVGGYDSLMEVSSKSIEYLLFNCVYSSSAVFPEEIKKGLIKNSYGTIINFDVDAVPKENRIMCVNGVLYGCEKLTPPAMFSSVTGPAFQYKKYSYYLKMLDASGMMMSLCSPEARYLTLIPNNTQMNNADITLVNNVLTKTKAGLAASTQGNYVYAHLVNPEGTPGHYTDLPTSGNHVLRTLSPNLNLYWYLKNGKITNSVKYNELISGIGSTEKSVFSDFTELTYGNGWSNGKVYSYDSLLFEGTLDNAIYSQFQSMMYNNRNTESFEFYGFVQLLNMAGMFIGQSYSFVAESCITFVPTTSAIKKAIIENRIPGITTTNTSENDAAFFTKCTVTSSPTLVAYLSNYFLPISTAGVSNYPFIGWNEDKPYGIPTLESFENTDANGKTTITYTMLKINDNGSKLSIQLQKSGSHEINVIEKYNYFPFIFNDGCVHFIEDVF